jgi:hypothetical protein
MSNFIRSSHGIVPGTNPKWIAKVKQRLFVICTRRWLALLWTFFEERGNITATPEQGRIQDFAEGGRVQTL